MFQNFHKDKYNSGLTLIELLVVISIFAIITSITIFNYGKFNSSSSLQNLADDIALTIRRAQGYAVGVRGLGDEFGYGYGIHFSTNPNVSDLAVGSNKSFILFMDMGASPDKSYGYNDDKTCGNPSSANECVEILSIKSSDKIDAIYLNDDFSSPLDPSYAIDILFKRPNPEPTFCIDMYCENISSVKIKILSENDSDVYKIVTVFNNGQISVSNN